MSEQFAFGLLCGSIYGLIGGVVITALGGPHIRRDEFGKVSIDGMWFSKKK